MADPLNVLISTFLVSSIDLDPLHATGVDVRTIEYGIPAEERTLRESSPDDVVARGELTPLTDEQRDAYAWADALIAFDSPLDLPSLAPKLRWIQTIGSGVSQYHASGLAGSDITLTNAAGLAAAPISEWVIGRILEIYKRFPTHLDSQLRHQWEPAYGTNLHGSAAMIVGLGAIGREVAARLRPFGVQLIGVRNSYQPGMSDDDVDELIGPGDIAARAGDVDTIVLCANATEDNEDLFDAAMFDRMRDASTFINVARGTLVDEEALVAALGSGKLRGAATDVARIEPLTEDSALWDAPNLRISPHSSVATDRYGERVLDLFLDNLPRFQAGEPLRRVVDF